MQLPFATECLFYSLILFVVHQLHWQMLFCKVGSKTGLVFLKSAFQVSCAAYVILTVRTFEDVGV